MHLAAFQLSGLKLLSPDCRNSSPADIDGGLREALADVCVVLLGVVGEIHAGRGTPSALGRDPGGIVGRAVVLAGDRVGHHAGIDVMVEDALEAGAIDAVMGPVADGVGRPDEDRRHR